MKAFKCDRCGKFDTGASYRITRPSSVEYGLSDELSDVCADCFWEYKDWWADIKKGA